MEAIRNFFKNLFQPQDSNNDFMESNSLVAKVAFLLLVLIVFIILGTIGVILTVGVSVHHWMKNGSRNKTLGNLTYSQNRDIGETWLKRSQFIITSFVNISCFQKSGKAAL